MKKSQDEMNNLVDEFRLWSRNHRRENYGRWDAYHAGYVQGTEDLDILRHNLEVLQMRLLTAESRLEMHEEGQMKKDPKNRKWLFSNIEQPPEEDPMPQFYTQREAEDRKKKKDRLVNANELLERAWEKHDT